jgi:hypothetical protein
MWSPSASSDSAASTSSPVIACVGIEGVAASAGDCTSVTPLAFSIARSPLTPSLPPPVKDDADDARAVRSGGGAERRRAGPGGRGSTADDRSRSTAGARRYGVSYLTEQPYGAVDAVVTALPSFTS